jgi:hypothetical protein
MKVTKKGKVKLETGDRRVGNFVYHREKAHYKLQDIGGLMSLRVSNTLMAGVMMSEIMDDGGENFLGNYAATMWNLICCVPDIELMADVHKAVTACLNRHKDLYGLKEDLSAEEDAKILREEMELHEAEVEARKEEGLE